MAHGAGGKSSQTLIEGLLVPALANEGLERMEDAGTLAVGDAALAVTTDSFVVRPTALPGRLDRRAGGQRDRQRPGRLGRPGARADALARARGGPSDRAAARRGGGGGRRRGRGGRGGDRGRHEGRRARPGRRHVRLHDRRRSRRPASGAVARTGCGPGDRVLVSGPVGAHGMAIMLARGEFELRGPDRIGHGIAVAGR